MFHSITFKNCENNWTNAFPLGNGVFGAMAFYRGKSLSLPMNHYEVYYNIKKDVLPEDILKSSPKCEDPGALHRTAVVRADRNRVTDGQPYCDYRDNKAGDVN